jgi:hypothetical protein
VSKNPRLPGEKVSQLSQGQPKQDFYFFGLFDAREKSLIPLQLIAIALAIIESIQGIINIVNPESDEFAHTFAHLGSYSLAYAAALFVVGFKPARARGLLILFVVATLGFLATSIIDVLQGNAGLATEVQHTTKLIPPFIVWIISKRAVYKFQPRKAK